MLIIENNYSQMTVASTSTGPYPFHEISHNQMVKSFFLDSLTNFIFEVLNQRWAVGEGLVLLSSRDDTKTYPLKDQWFRCLCCT